MSEYDRTQLEKALRTRMSFEGRGINPPPQLRTAAIAAKYGISEQEVRNRLHELDAKTQ